MLGAFIIRNFIFFENFLLEVFEVIFDLVVVEGRMLPKSNRAAGVCGLRTRFFTDFVFLKSQNFQPAFGGLAPPANLAKTSARLR